MFARHWAVSLGLATMLWGVVPRTADWVPARWPWKDVPSLELLAGTPINCLLLKAYDHGFLAGASQRGVVTLAVVSGSDAVSLAEKALAAGVTGIVLEGEFPEAIEGAVRRAAGKAPVIPLTARWQLRLASKIPIIGTYQGVWPGIETEENGAKKAGPTGTIWVDTNTGFLRGVHAATDATLWIANSPPGNTIVTAERYMQAIADAAASGAHWVLALDNDFAGRLHRRQPSALRDWRRITQFLRYFEAHPEWRAMSEFGKVAVIQDPLGCGRLSGGLLDTMATNQMPARPVAPQDLTANALRGISLAVNLESGNLTAGQEKVLRDFAAAGGKLLAAPAGWHAADPSGQRITLSTAEFERLDRLWNDVTGDMPRHSYGVSVFNAPSMISNVVRSVDAKTIVVHLVNYTDYPVEAVSVAFPGDYAKATLLTPEGMPQSLAISRKGSGALVTLDKVATCAAVQIER